MTSLLPQIAMQGSPVINENWKENKKKNQRNRKKRVEC